LKQLNEKIVKYLERIKEKKYERSSEEERRKGEETEPARTKKKHTKPHRIPNPVQRNFVDFLWQGDRLVGK
jgi:hypothetical protein